MKSHKHTSHGSKDIEKSSTEKTPFLLKPAPVISPLRKTAGAVGEFLFVNIPGFTTYVVIDVFAPPVFKNFFTSAQKYFVLGHPFLNTLTTAPYRFLHYVSDAANPLFSLQALKDALSSEAADLCSAETIVLIYAAINAACGREVEEITLLERGAVYSVGNGILHECYLGLGTALKRLGVFGKPVATSDKVLTTDEAKRNEEEVELSNSGPKSTF